MISRVLRQLGLGAEAAGLLTLATVAVKLTPGRRTPRLLGDVNTDPDRPPDADCPLEARRIGVAVERVAALLPWHPVCLPQAIATRLMLRRRGIPAQLHLGVVETSPLSAHAWVTVEGRAVQGGRVRATRVATFT
jgi:Transglutaminase-like superfamily